MRRLKWGLLAVVLLAGAVRAEEPPRKMYKIGIVQITDAFVYSRALQGFLKELAAQGYQRGVNVDITRRTVLGPTKGLWDKAQVYFALKGYIQEFADAKVDLVITVGTPATLHGAPLAHKDGLRVMFAGVSDPELVDFRKEGWITGSTTFMHPSVVLDYIKQLTPRVKKIMTTVSTDPNAIRYYTLLAEAGKKAGYEVTDFRVDTNADAPKAAAFMRTAPVDAFVVIPDTWIGRDDVANGRVLFKDGAAPRKMLIVSAIPETFEIFPEDMSFAVGGSFSESGRQAAILVTKIIGGADPGSLPIVYQDKPTLKYSLKVLEKYGIPADSITAPSIRN